MKDSQIVSTKELSELLKQECYQPFQEPEKDLVANDDFIKDNDIIGTYKSSLVLDHLLVDRMMSIEPEQVKWLNITHTFSFDRIINIARIWLHPLTWVPIDKQITNKYIVKGQIATEKLDNDRLNNSDLEVWIEWILAERINLFAENDVVAYTDLTIDNKQVLKEMRLWHFITEDTTPVQAELLATGEHKYAETIPFDADTLTQNLYLIAEHSGAQRAALLIDELRQDWSYIKQLHLFAIDLCTDEQITRFEYTLFRELEPQRQLWLQTNDGKEQKTEKVQVSDNSQPAKDDIENLFTFVFWNTGNCRRLIDKLLEERDSADDPEWLRHALEIYEADGLIRTPRDSFRKWLKKFCKAFGRQVTYYPPSTINRTPSTTSLSSYLFIPEKH